MKIQPNNHFTEAVSRIKTSLDDSRTQIYDLKKLFEEISQKRQLTLTEIKNLEHIERIDELLTDIIPKITFYKP